MILCIGVLCVAVLVPVVGKKKVSSEVRRAAVVMILVSALAILAQISEEMESGGIELELVRPSYGEGDYEEEMTVDAEGILDGYSYQVVVPERILSKQEEQKLLEAAQQEIDDEFVKNNGEVREKAEIRKNYQEGAVSADWEFEPYDVVDDEGRVVEENIPENGILVKAAVTLRCESSECISERYFRVMPKELDEEHKMIREIENYLKKQSADPGDSIKLPEQLNGKKLIWNTKKEHLSEKILFLGGGIVIILPFVEQSRKKEREKKRKALLELQYADMVSNLVLLLGAGMTVSKAWNRLTENYMNERQKRTICRKEVYEEMQRTSFEIKNGMGEERAYERFGERCGGYRYRKFGNLLAQNLRKGSRGLTRLLEQEAEDAFEERKSMARKLGEEAGTKMLFPMILMLGAVMLILAFPAMRSMEL